MMSPLLAVILATLNGLSQPVGAALVLTEVSGSAEVSVQFFGTSLPPASDAESFGPLGGVAVAEVGRTRAAQTGSGLNAVAAEGRFDDVPSFELLAATEIDQTVGNTGPGSEALAFQYLINGGELRLFNRGGSFEGLVATVAVSIFVLAPDFGGILWDWGATLRGSGGTAVAEIHGFAPIFELNDPLNLGIPTLSAVTISGSEAVLSIAPFLAFADLGALGPGGNALISYSMYASVSGPALNGGGGKASLGDPFDFTGNPGSVISIPGAAAIPEPKSWALLLLGTAALLASARRLRHLPG
jgi:hypothetical protein